MKSRTRLSNFTFTFHFHALEKAMATHSSVLTWRIPGTEEPGGLPSMGLHRVRNDWSELAVAAAGCYLHPCAIPFPWVWVDPMTCFWLTECGKNTGMSLLWLDCKRLTSVFLSVSLSLALSFSLVLACCNEGNCCFEMFYGQIHK